MINIISENNDLSTHEILEYLLSFDEAFTRYNVEDSHSLTFEIDNSETFIPLKNTYHRRARLNTVINNIRDSVYGYYIVNEENPIIKALEYISKNEGYNYVGEYNDEEQHNKLIDLYLARKIGLKIPKTLVTNNTEDLLLFYKNCNKKVITKCIKYPLNLKFEKFQIIGNNTFMITQRQIKRLSKIHTLGLYQGYVNKLYEIRVFFYKNNFFPMAIFSQQNKKTKIDYREYDEVNPNRYVPYKLTKEIEDKISAFCEIKKINTGSIDLIFDGTEYVFLENNPQGQFDWVSKNCNYYIEKFIALDLIKNKINEKE